MAADTMERLGIGRGTYVVKVNNRKILDGLMETVGLGGEAEAPRRLTVLRAIDKLDRLGRDEVGQLLGGGRRDESGDFTKGAGLERAAIDAVLAYAGAPSTNRLAGSNSMALRQLDDSFGKTASAAQGIEELREIAALCESAGYGHDRVRIDPSVVRGLEYYTGPVYEVDLLFEVADLSGRPVRFGSVAGGGRYDGLVARFRGEPVPAAGFSIGVSRLAAALAHLGRLSDGEPAGPVVVCVMDRDRLADYLAMAQELRDAGIRAEVYLGGAGLKTQLKYADRRKAPVAVLQGSDEAQRGELQLKDLALGAEMARSIAGHAEWREARVAQRLVPRQALVATVRDMLAPRSV
jgi:histidyl-tRNA synthetase